MSTHIPANNQDNTYLDSSLIVQADKKSKSEEKTHNPRRIAEKLTNMDLTLKSELESKF